MYHIVRAARLPLLGALLASSLGAFLAPAAAALESQSASFRNARSAVGDAGRRKTSSSFRLDGTAGTLALTTATSSGYRVRDGLQAGYHFPSAVTDLWGSSNAAAGTIYLQWTAPGNDDGEDTTAGAFVVRYATTASESPALSNAKFEAATAVTPAPPSPSIRGSRHTLVVTGLQQGVTHYFCIKTAERDGTRSSLSLGATAQVELQLTPALWFVGVSSIGATYNTVGAQGYTVQASTSSDFTTVVSSTVFGNQGYLAPYGLNPNTTYFIRAGALWDGATTYSQTTFSTATLSKLVTGATVYQVNVTSMVVNWIPLALSPPEASSNSASGYILQASTRSDFAPVWAASATPNVALSTLTISDLRGDVTFYFRVGSLNTNGALSFAPAVSSYMPVQLGVEMTTHVITGISGMDATTVITTSTILTNTGNVKATWWLRVTTTTAGSPWRAGSSAGTDRYVMWTVVDPASSEPAAGDFNAEDILADADAACGASAFSKGAGTCVQVPVGGTRKLWFKVATPTSTSTNAAQDIRITARAVRDPDPDPNP